jgi:hypothetical protein
LARNRCIYAIDEAGVMLMIDTANSTYSFSGNANNPDDDSNDYHWLWGNTISGVDGWIYFPLLDVNQIIKFDPENETGTLEVQIGFPVARNGGMVP